MRSSDRPELSNSPKLHGNNWGRNRFEAAYEVSVSSACLPSSQALQFLNRAGTVFGKSCDFPWEMNYCVGALKVVPKYVHAVGFFVQTFLLTERVKAKSPLYM